MTNQTEGFITNFLIRSKRKLKRKLQSFYYSMRVTFYYFKLICLSHVPLYIILYC